MAEPMIRHLGGVTLPPNLLAAEHQQHMAWADHRLSLVEQHVAKPLAKTYLARYATKPRSAAIWLRNMSAACQQAAERFPVPPHELRNELRRDMIAAEWSGRCQTILADMTANGAVRAADLLEALAGQAKAWHFCPPLPKEFDKKAFKKDVEERQQALLAGVAEEKREEMSRAFEASNGPASDPAVDLFEQRAASIMVRLLDEGWWRRRINRAWDVYCELIAIFTGQVRKGVSPYASHHARREHMARKTAQYHWAESRKVVNEELGQECDLLEAMMASVSNPMVRRCELMVRMRGFEELAKEQGHVGLFVTLTAPSQYHAWKQNQKTGKTFQNDKYNGSTPTQTQKMLCSQWAQFRAAIARRGLRTYGFRIAEPHHDATPHWHALFFVEPAQQQEFLTLLTFYFTQRDRHELGMPNTETLDYLNHNRIRNKAAKALALININDRATVKAIKPRVAWEIIDESKGSATGYIAKYVAKNIDGHRVGWDEEAEEAVETSTTGVAAWASRHRIRQFQQVSGPSVTVWRELRRLRDQVVEWDEILETARAAVNGSRWGDFIKAMGGIMLPRAEHLIQLSKRLESEATRYGEDRLRLMGVMSQQLNKLAQTRFEGWVIVKKGTKANQSSGTGVVFGERSELQSSGGSRAPRSSVNNCTEGSKTGVKGSALAKELIRMGLDESNASLLQHGCIINADGQYVRLVGDRLIVTRHWPGAGDAVADQLTAEVEAELASNSTASSAALKQQARELMHSGGSITDWLADMPLAQAEEAISIFTRLLDDEEDRGNYQPTEQEQARVASMQSDNQRHGADIAKARARLGVD
ncbi:replication endonuclease [Aeromonas veronii]|uniref:replication endonuclease n=1 Tax=Aeromonas veronii TaxID=654 RepID=UPI001FD6B699|nr:replication endonuclease [Aeromonas veronii]MCJ8215432.1 replication endonuclease [Aeromonas veronii]